MKEYSYTSTQPLGHTGPVTGSLYLYLLYIIYINIFDIYTQQIFYDLMEDAVVLHKVQKERNIQYKKGKVTELVTFYI